MSSRTTSQTIYCAPPSSGSSRSSARLNQLSRVDPVLASQIPDLPRLVAFRNILIHGYAIVDDALVWDAAVVQLPQLRTTLAALLEDPADTAEP